VTELDKAEEASAGHTSVVQNADGAEFTERRPAGTWGRYARVSARWLIRLVVLVLLAMLVHLLVTSKTIKWHTVGHYFTEHSILLGVVRTLELTVLGMAIGVVLGVVLALMRLSNSLLLRSAASLFLWFFRGTPLLVQILFWFNLASFIKRISIGVPFGPTFASWDTNSLITPFVAAILALGLNQGAYMCEIVRAGILSVDQGQLEASLTLGMTRSRAMRRVVLPQAMRIIIPPTGNHAIALLKDSSLVSVISMTELLYSAQLIYANTFETIPLLIVVSLWYLLMTTVTSIGQYYLERHFGRGATRTPPPSALAQLRQTWLDGVGSVFRGRQVRI
jgi:polar amino acid transport system permease protein